MILTHACSSSHSMTLRISKQHGSFWFLELFIHPFVESASKMSYLSGLMFPDRLKNHTLSDEDSPNIKKTTPTANLLQNWLTVRGYCIGSWLSHYGWRSRLDCDGSIVSNTFPLDKGDASSCISATWSWSTWRSQQPSSHAPYVEENKPGEWSLTNRLDCSLEWDPVEDLQDDEDVAYLHEYGHQELIIFLDRV